MVNWIDVVIGIPLGISIVKGFQRGLVVSLFSLVGIFIGIYVAIRFSALLAPKLQSIFNVDADWLPLVTICFLFVGVYLGVLFLAKAIEKLLDIAALGFANKIGGAIFNLLKMVLIFGALLAAINSYNPTYKIISDLSKKESLLYQPVYNISSLLIPALKSSTFLQPILHLKEDLKDELN